LLLLTACAGEASSDVGGTAAGLSATPQARLTHVLPRGGASTLSLRTLPNAICKLRLADEPIDPQRQLRLVSDDEGVVRVHLTHLASGADHGQLRLDCDDESGARFSHVVDVEARTGAPSIPPAPITRTGKPTLPILDVDPMSLADDELHRRHYPPRPDPTTNPDQYSHWLDLVTSQPLLVSGHLVQDPERTHSSATTSNNWSGYVINNASSSPKYAWIYGEWSVPRAYAESGFWSSDHSSLWVGIDGWGMPDVVQDGTDQDTLTGFWIQTSSYDAWTEWYPFNSVTVSNFSVNPGDDIRAWTWTLDSSGHYSANATVGWFYLYNATQNVAVESSTNIPSGISFNGHCAEWVMERPTVNGSVSTLAQYASPTNLINALAYDLNGGTHYYSSDNSLQVTMTNGSTVLSRVAPLNSSTMAFTWVNHQ
jgi:hypothetical protein